MLSFKKNARRRALASAKLPPISFDKLPPDIAATLRATARRIKGIVRLRGSLAAAAALLISILAIMGLDAMMTIYNSGVRWALWSAGLAATLATAWRTLARPLSKPFTPGRIAAFIEAHHPELEERLSTVVEILSQPGGADEGAAQLLGVLTEAAVKDAKTVSPRKEFTTRTVKPKLAAAGGAVAVLAALFAIWPASTGRLVARAIVPSAEIDNVYGHNLTLTPGNKTVLAGSPLTVNLAVKGGWPGRAFMRTITLKPGASEVSERLNETAAERTEQDAAVRNFQHFIPAVNESFRYRAECSGALTRFYEITAVPKPALSSLVIKRIFPAYTGMAPATNNAGDLAIEAVAGTRVEITAAPERELEPRFFLGTNAVPLSDGSTAARYGYAFEMAEGGASAWRLQLSDANAFTNDTVWNPVRCVEDSPPAIELAYPQKLSHTLKPYSELPFSFTAGDDFAVARVEMRVSIGAEPYAVLREAALARNPETGFWEGQDSIDLVKIKAPAGSRLRVQLAAVDNLPPELGGPQTAFAPPIEINIEADANSYLDILVEEQYEMMADAAEQIRLDLEEAKKRAEEALKEIDAQKDPEAVGKTAESRDEIQKAEEKLRDLMAKSEASLFENMMPDMQRLLERRIEPAEEQADIAIAAEKEERRPEVEELIEKLDEALERLNEFKEDVEAQKEELEKAADLDDIVNQEEALAEKALEMTPEEFLQEQQEIKNEFEQQTQEPQEPMQDAIKRVEELRDQIDTLRDKQEDVKNAVEDLAKEDKRAAAEEALKEMTPDMPQDTTPEARAQQAEEVIEEEASDIENEISDISGAIKNLDVPEISDPATQPLDQAADAMEAAAEDAGEAEEALEEDQKSEAAGEMEQADEDMRDASQKLRDAKGEMEKLAEKLDALAEQQMQEAMDAMEAAMEQAGEGEEPPPPENGEGAPPPPPPDMKGAAEKAQDAAEAMKKLAQQMAKQAGLPKAAMPGKPMPGPPKPAPGPEGNKDIRKLAPAQSSGMPEYLRRAGLTPADWFKMRSNMSRETVDDALLSVPPEYRELVKAYFIEISKQQ